MCDCIAGDVADVMVDERVAVLFADASCGHQPSGAQHLQMLRHRGLGNTECIDEFMNASVGVGEFADDLQTTWMRKRLQQGSSVDE